MHWEPLHINSAEKVLELKCTSNDSMEFFRAKTEPPDAVGGPLDPSVDQSSGDLDFRWACNTPNLREYQAGQHLQSWYDMCCPFVVARR